jgi:hypothetical protein
MFDKFIEISYTTCEANINSLLIGRGFNPHPNQECEVMGFVLKGCGYVSVLKVVVCGISSETR